MSEVPSQVNLYVDWGNIPLRNPVTFPAPGQKPHLSWLELDRSTRVKYRCWFEGSDIVREALDQMYVDDTPGL